MAPEDHPGDTEGEDDHVGNTGFAHNLADGEDGERGDGEHHHLAVMTAVDVGEVFGREGVEEAEERAPPAVTREVPGEEQGAHEGDPYRQDELDAHGARGVGQELDGDQRVVGVGEQGVDGGDAAEAAVVPFRDDGVLRTDNAAAQTV